MDAARTPDSVIADIHDAIGTLSMMMIDPALSSDSTERMHMVLMDGGLLLGAWEALNGRGLMPADLVAETDCWTQWIRDTSSRLERAVQNAQDLRVSS